jgi:hypothetical protein
MSTHHASRTLLKSPPELWAECSDARSLARHLDDSFGEIRITNLEPEQTVAWEGERIRGTVKLEPSGWGTKVTLTASGPEPDLSCAPSVDRAGPEPDPDRCAVEQEPDQSGAEPEPEPDQPGAEPEPDRSGGESDSSSGRVRRGFLSRLRYLLWAPDSSPRPAPAATRPPGGAPGPVPAPIPTERMGAPTAQHVPAVPQSQPAPPPEPQADVALTAALDSLGSAHHRPFSSV